MSAIEKLNIRNISSSEKGFLSENQASTANTFSYKWGRRNTYESKIFQEIARNWLVKRYLNNDPKNIEKYLGSKR